MTDRPKLGQVLIEAGVIDELQLTAALGEQSRWGGRLGSALVALGHVEEDQLVRVLARSLGVPAVRLEGKRIDASMAELVDGAYAEKNACVPLFIAKEGGNRVLYLGMEDPHDLSTIDDLRFRLGFRVRPVLVGPVQLRNATTALYAGHVTGAEPPVEVEDVGETSAPDVVQATEVSRQDEDRLFFPAADRREDEPQPEALRSQPKADADDGDRAGQVPTRQILRAVTRLLLAKGVFTREELLKTVRLVGEAEEAETGDG